MRQVWSAYREPSFGHGIMEFTDSGTAYFTWNRNQDPVSGTSADKVSLIDTAIPQPLVASKAPSHAKRSFGCALLGILAKRQAARLGM